MRAASVHAEGAPSEAREKALRAGRGRRAGEHATRPPARTAFERFTARGPARAAAARAAATRVIWSMRARAGARAGAARRSANSSARSPRLRDAGRAVRSPSKARRAAAGAARARRRASASASVYIGNAAQTLHPVAGQGLNLGLRDAWELAQRLAGRARSRRRARCCSASPRARRLDARATIRITRLARRRVSSAPIRCARAARGVALDRAGHVSGAARAFLRAA